MEKPQIKKVNFSDGKEFPFGSDLLVFKEAVLSSLSYKRKNEYSDKLKSFLVEKSGESKGFLFDSIQGAYSWFIKSAREYAFKSFGKEKREIIVLSPALAAKIAAFNTEDDDIKYVNVNHLGNFIASLSEKTCAVLLEFTDGKNGFPFQKEFIEQIYEICAVRDIIFAVDESETSAMITGDMFCYMKYGVLPDAVLFGGVMARAFSLGVVLTGKKLAKSANGGEVGSVPCAGAFAIYDEVSDRAEFIKRKSKELSTALSICKKVKSYAVNGFVAYADVENGKECADALKEKGLKVGYSENRLLFNIAAGIDEREFDFGIKAIKEVLLGAQNPFDGEKTD